jgi:hypothetical protein
MHGIEGQRLFRLPMFFGRLTERPPVGGGAVWCRTFILSAVVGPKVKAGVDAWQDVIAGLVSEACVAQDTDFDHLWTDSFRVSLEWDRSAQWAAPSTRETYIS